MSGNIYEINEAAFEAEVLQAKTPVLVDFWASWCGPCKALIPTLEAFAGENQGNVKVVKVDVDENPGIAAQYGVRSVPTMLLFNGGERVDQLVGNVPKGAIEEIFKKVG